jgi:hypothetical protein
VVQRIDDITLIPPGSPEFIKTLIADWQTPQVQKYLSDLIAKDSLL